MRSLAGHGIETHGIEPSAAFRDAAIKQGGISPDRLKLGSVESVTYPAETFDFATFGAVLEHLSDPARQIARVMSWLAPGGLIHVEVPSSHWLTSRIANLVYRAQGLDYVTNLSPMHPPFHLYEFTAESFAKLAERTGHSVAFSRLLTGDETYLPGPDRMWRYVMARTGTGMQLEIWLQAPGQSADSAAISRYSAS
jgi:hypothetical protein